jgi:glycosyltransferase involved in cell wall biosynthesis
MAIEGIPPAASATLADQKNPVRRETVGIQFGSFDIVAVQSGAKRGGRVCETMRLLGLSKMPTRSRPLLLHVFSSFAVGGAQVRFAAIANRYPQAWRHAIVAMDGNLECRERLDADVDATYPDVEIRKGDTFGNVRRFRRALRALRPQALITGNWGSIEWAMANALPVVRHIHTEDGFGPEERDRQLPRRVWTRRIFLRGATVVVPSRTLWRIATEQWRLSPPRVRYIPNGIDLARFARAATAVLPGDGPVIGCVAALRAEKNFPRLIRAFHLVAAEMPARLVIVGDGPERGALEQLVASLDLSGRVLFAGHVPEPAPLYRAFDVFALTSDTEQMPMTVLEAMAAALPVAATDVGDIKAMLAPENSAFIVPRDEPALADAFRALLREPGLRHSVGAANRVRAEREYDQEVMFRAYAELFGS